MQPASTKTPCDFYVCKYRNIYHIHPYTHTPIHHKVKRTVEEEDHTVEQIQRDSLWSSQGEGEPHAQYRMGRPKGKCDKVQPPQFAISRVPPPRWVRGSLGEQNRDCGKESHVS